MIKFYVNNESHNAFILDLDIDVMYCWGTISNKFYQCQNIIYKADVLILEYK